jgi:bile acid-coenzyme A ligase
VSLDAVDYLVRKHRETPRDVAITMVDRRGADEDVSWGALGDAAMCTAERLTALGTPPDGRLVVALGSSVDHFATVFGGWLAGQLVLVVPPDLGESRLRGVIDRFRPQTVVDPDAVSSADAAAERPPARSAMLSGGTTGDPKIVLRRRPWMEKRSENPGFTELCRPGDVTLVCTPLYGMGFQTAWDSILHGNRTVVLGRFSPAAWLRAVETYGVTFTRLVPTQMKWIAESAGFAGADLSSLRVVHHTAAACPADVKRAWIERVSPQVVYESYSSREDVLSTSISGEEWLAHPGSVGRVRPAIVRVLDETLTEVPVGQVGRVFLRPHDGHPLVETLGPALETTPDGKFVCLGDLGRVDEDGYLYLVDRASEMFMTGGLNVFPAQIERELIACPGVHDCVVVGEAHPDLGHVAVAYVALKAGVGLDDVTAFAAGRLSGTASTTRNSRGSAVPRDASGKGVG